MMLRILLAFFGGFALAVASAIAWMVLQGDGKLPPLEGVGGGGVALGAIAALLTWLMKRPPAEVRQAAAAAKQADAKPGKFRLSGKAKVEEEPLIENFQRRRGPADLSASAAAEVEAPEPKLPADDAALPELPHTTLIPPVSVVRRERLEPDAWSGARSWLGGLPRLGDATWPIGVQTGRPLPFGAQIDLAELAKIRPETQLPKAGWLACFLDEGALVYVPARASGERHAITPAPEGTAAQEPDGEMFPATPSPLADATLPYWPVDLAALELAQWDVEEAAPEEPAEMPPCDRLWWRSVRLLIDQLRLCLHRAPARIAAEADEQKAKVLEREAGALPAVIGLLEDFSADAPDWERLPDADLDDFINTYAAIQQQFPRLTRYGVPRQIDELALQTMLEMFTGPPEAFAALPEGFRTYINQAMRRPAEHGHQIFGEVADIHGRAAELQPTHHLLLQLAADEMIRLEINSGVYSFWLDPASITAREWSKAQVLVEC